MIKKNNFNNKKNNNQNNYFTKNVRDKGEDFIFMKSAKDLEYDAVIVFRDIARGRVDLNKFSNYFLNPQFLESMIKTAYDKWFEYNLSYSGISMFINYHASQGTAMDNNTYVIQESHKRLSEAYSIIYNTMIYIRQTQDVSNLFALASQLNIYSRLL